MAPRFVAVDVEAAVVAVVVESDLLEVSLVLEEMANDAAVVCVWDPLLAPFVENKCVDAAIVRTVAGLDAVKEEEAEEEAEEDGEDVDDLEGKEFSPLMSIGESEEGEDGGEEEHEPISLSESCARDESVSIGRIEADVGAEAADIDG